MITALKYANRLRELMGAAFTLQVFTPALPPAAGTEPEAAPCTPSVSWWFCLLQVFSERGVLPPL